MISTQPTKSGYRLLPDILNLDNPHILDWQLFTFYCYQRTPRLSGLKILSRVAGYLSSCYIHYPALTYQHRQKKPGSKLSVRSFVVRYLAYTLLIIIVYFRLGTIRCQMLQTQTTSSGSKEYLISSLKK